MRHSLAAWTAAFLCIFAAACTGPGTGPDDGGSEPAAVGEERQELHAVTLSSLRGGALDASSDCAGNVPTPRIVLRFRGLADLAAADPGTATSTTQPDVAVALVNATDPTKLPVKGNAGIVVHRPWLYFPSSLNGSLGQPTGDPGIRRLPLQSTDLVVEEKTAGAPVHLHWEPRLGDVPTPALDSCSLRWMAPVDELVPGKSLRPGVFAAPDRVLVTSLLSIREGEVFTSDYFRKDDESGEACVVTFPQTPVSRALTKSFSIAVPVAAESRTLTVKATKGASTHSWVFTLPPDVDEEVLLVRNLPVAGRGRDFAAHYALRQGMDSPSVVVPLPEFPDCENGPPNDNPQCSPGDNRWP